MSAIFFGKGRGGVCLFTSRSHIGDHLLRLYLLLCVSMCIYLTHQKEKDNEEEDEEKEEEEQGKKKRRRRRKRKEKDKNKQQ